MIALINVHFKTSGMVVITGQDLDLLSDEERVVNFTGKCYDYNCRLPQSPYFSSYMFQNAIISSLLAVIKRTNVSNFFIHF